MERKAIKNNKVIIVMILSLSYAVCVGIFAVIRYVSGDLMMAALDAVLSAIGFYFFFQVWYTKKAYIPAYAIATVAVLGTVATLIIKGPEQVYWVYPSVALVFYLLPNRHAMVLWLITMVVTMILLKDLPGSQMLTISMTILITSFFCYFFTAKMDAQNKRLQHIANQDVLTEILNRRAFNHDTEKLKLSDNSESAILFDLDRFKQVNDRYGHATGDDVLMQVTALVSAQLNSNSLLYRMGGDEFAILCFGCQFDYAYQLAQKIHSSFNLSAVNQEHGITLSMAVAEKELDESIDDWLGRLDSALYKAKKSGRNIIVKSIRQ